MATKQEDLPLVLPTGMRPGIYLHPETYSELLESVPVLRPSETFVWQGVRIRPSKYIPRSKFLKVDENGEMRMFNLRKRGVQ